MAILDKATLLERIKGRIGEDTSDEAISLIEDVSDTFSDLETKASDETKWEKKYRENDAEWRKKYRDRFFNGTPDDENDEEEEAPKPLTFDALFKEG